jgi:hypothetical protein
MPIKIRKGSIPQENYFQCCFESLLRANSRERCHENNDGSDDQDDDKDYFSSGVIAALQHFYRMTAMGATIRLPADLPAACRAIE